MNERVVGYKLFRFFESHPCITILFYLLLSKRILCSQQIIDLLHSPKELASFIRRIDFTCDITDLKDYQPTEEEVTDVFANIWRANITYGKTIELIYNNVKAFDLQQLYKECLQNLLKQDNLADDE